MGKGKQTHDAPPPAPESPRSSRMNGSSTLCGVDIYTQRDKDPRFPFSLMRFRIVGGGSGNGGGIFHDLTSRITGHVLPPVNGGAGGRAVGEDS